MLNRIIIKFIKIKITRKTNEHVQKEVGYGYQNIILAHKKSTRYPHMTVTGLIEL